MPMQTGDLWQDAEMDERLCKDILSWLGRSRYALLCPDEAERLRTGAATAIETLEDRLQGIERRYQRGEILDERMYEEAVHSARTKVARRYRYAYETYIKIATQRFPNMANKRLHL